MDKGLGYAIIKYIPGGHFYARQDLPVKAGFTLENK